MAGGAASRKAADEKLGKIGSTGRVCVCVWWAYWPLAHWTRRQAHVGPAHFRPGPPQPGLLCQAASFSQEEISLLKVERNGMQTI